MVTPVNATSSTQATSSSQNSLGQEDLMKIMLTQLTYQDPLKPMDNQQFITQMAQFTALEQTRAMNDKLEALLTSQSTTQAFGLIGKHVRTGDSRGGLVTSVTFNQGRASIQAGGYPIDLAEISYVGSAPEPQSPNPAPGSGVSHD